MSVSAAEKLELIRLVEGSPPPVKRTLAVIETALLHTELSPRELARRITDRDGKFISESSVYRILKAADQKF